MTPSEEAREAVAQTIARKRNKWRTRPELANTVTGIDRRDVDMILDAYEEHLRSKGFEMVKVGVAPEWMPEIPVDIAREIEDTIHRVSKDYGIPTGLYRLSPESTTAGADHKPEHRDPNMGIDDGPMLCKHCDGYLCFGKTGRGELMHVRELSEDKQ